ncbi:beta strand repeat-containing protein, partial [Flavobacterium urumqiense]
MKTFLHKSHFLSIIFLLTNLFFASVAFGQATVSTDLLDYRPGSTAIITGSGFQAGETVILLVEHVGEEPAGTDPQYHQPWTVVADSIGNIQTSWYVPTVEEGDALGATFLLTADSQSGAHAQWTFTDAGNANDGDGTITVLTAPTSKCSGSTGNSLTFTFTAPNGKDFNAVSELTLLVPIGWTTPQNTTSTNPGFISLSGTASAKSIYSISGSLITITMTCSAGSTVIITYEGGGTKVTVPTVGTNTIYTFTTQTKQNGGTLTNIASQPIVTLNANNNAGAASSTPTLCINTVLTNITHTTTVATGIGSPMGLPTGVTAVFASNTITISGTPTASGTFNYTIPLSGGCGSVNATGTITVTPNNTVSAASSTPTSCINIALTNISHTTTGATGLGSATGLPAGVTAAWASNTITISGTPTASGIFNYTISLTGGCGSINATGTITVKANNTVGAASSTPTLCINTVLTNITHTTTGATGIGSLTGLPAGIAAAFASNAITISGTPTASGTFNYTIPITGSCSSVNATGTITVKANNTVGAASLTPTLCINTILTDITHTTTGAIGIGSPTGLPAGVTAAFASNTITIGGTPTASGTFNYSIPLTGGCSSANATGTITVTPNNSVGAASSTPTVCINTVLTNITHATTGATGIGSATGLPAGVTAAFAFNAITISGTPTVSGTFNYTISLTGGCGSINATGTITVKANNTVGAASSTPTLCINTLLTNITHTTTGATGIGSPTGLPAGVAAAFTSNTITISGTPTASGIFNYSLPLTGGCSSLNATGTITIRPVPVATTTPSTQTICSGDAIIAIVTNSNISGTTYAWTSSVTGNVDIVPSIGSGDINSVIINNTTATKTVTFTITPTANGCIGTAITATVVVNPTPNAVATPTIQAICSGNIITAIVLSGSVGGTIFNWTRDNSSNITGISSSGTGNISGILSNTTTTAQSTIFTIIPTIGGCPGPPITATVTVNKEPSFTICPLNISKNTDPGVCNAVVTYTSTATGTPTATLTYVFFGATTGSGIGTGSGLTFNKGVTTVTITATNSCGTASCSFTVTVLDITAPVLAGVPVDATASCNTIPVAAIVTASDICDASPSIALVETKTQTPTGIGHYNYTLTRTWTATDVASNSSSKTQVITVQDTTKPVLSTVPADATVECDAVPAAATLTATDNCDAAPVVTYAEVRTNGASTNNYTLTRTWTATDVASNSSSKIQVITV